MGSPLVVFFVATIIAATAVTVTVDEGPTKVCLNKVVPSFRRVDLVLRLVASPHPLLLRDPPPFASPFALQYGCFPADAMSVQGLQIFLVVVPM
jgi:hypothetical protein